jgi:hypothetical protein
MWGGDACVALGLLVPTYHPFYTIITMLAGVGPILGEGMAGSFLASPPMAFPLLTRDTR